MPSPLNTPTNERLPNQLWTNCKIREGDVTELDIRSDSLNHCNQTNEDMDQKSNPIPNPLFTALNEERHQFPNNVSDISEPSDVRRQPSRLGLNLNLSHDLSEDKVRKKPAISFGNLSESPVQLIDVSVPLEKQGWFHGYISRTDAENVLRPMKGGSYLVRRCLSPKHHYSLSLKCVRGFMHIKIVGQSDGTYTFGTSNVSFKSIPEIISHYCYNRLSIRGAEHMSLIYPVIDQLL